MSTNSAFTGSYTENPFLYQHFHLRQIKVLVLGQPVVEFDAAQNCHFTCMVRQWKQGTFKVMSNHCQLIFSKYHYVLVIDLTSIQNASEKCHYPKLVGEPLRLELNFTFPLEHVIRLVELKTESLWLHLTGLAFLERVSKMHNVSLQQIKQSFAATQCSVAWLISLFLCSNSCQWNFFFGQQATQQYARWALDKDFKASLRNNFFRLFWT